MIYILYLLSLRQQSILLIIISHGYLSSEFLQYLLFFIYYLIS